MQNVLKFSIDSDGWVFVLIFVGISLILFKMSHFLGFIGIVLTVWCLCFFRDPERFVPISPNLVISPADGVVCDIAEVKIPEDWKLPKGKYTKVSIFMDVFNVHVNRLPLEGTIKKIVYYPGKFLNASLDKASEFNERQAFIVEGKDFDYAVVQIAGLIARRIRADVKEGQEVVKGQRIGMIRFGSRVDLYLPSKYAPQVCVGQTMVAGETIIADLSASNKPLVAEVM